MLLSGILIGSLFVGAAQSLTAPSFTYATKQTGYATITPADMRPESYVTQWSVTQGDLEGAGCYLGGIHFPQGSRMVSIDIHDDQEVQARAVRRTTVFPSSTPRTLVS